MCRLEQQCATQSQLSEKTMTSRDQCTVIVLRNALQPSPLFVTGCRLMSRCVCVCVCVSWVCVVGVGVCVVSFVDCFISQLVSVETTKYQEARLSFLMCVWCLSRFTIDVDFHMGLSSHQTKLCAMRNADSFSVYYNKPTHLTWKVNHSKPDHSYTQYIQYVRRHTTWTALLRLQLQTFGLSDLSSLMTDDHNFQHGHFSLRRSSVLADPCSSSRSSGRSAASSVLTASVSRLITSS